MDWPTSPVVGQQAFGPTDRQWTWDGVGWRRTDNGFSQIYVTHIVAAFPQTVSTDWALVNYV